MQLLRESFPDRPAFEIAVAHALLLRVGRGELPATLRVVRPGPTLAFGKLDALRPGYADACAAARAHGYEPVLRLAGGHAAAYDHDSLIVEAIVPSDSAVEGITDRFARATDALVRAIGPGAAVGELPREYCAGAWSVNRGGRVKVAGTAQRVVRGAALVSAVVTARGADRLRPVLRDVYAALAIDWDPATVGDLQVDPDQLAGRVIDVYAADHELARASLDAATLGLAAALEPRHAVRPDAPR